MKQNSFVYWWTHKPTGKYYIGKHKGTPEDGYIGSGVRFRAMYHLDTLPEEWSRKIVMYGTEQEVLDHEALLVDKERLKDPLCLNMVLGGGGYPSWTMSPAWIDNRLWHPEHGEVVVCADNNTVDISKKYDSLDTQKISNILRGVRSEINGWELADAQLQKRVEDNLERLKNWGVVYIKKDNHKVRKVYQMPKGNRKPNFTVPCRRAYGTNVSIGELLNKHMVTQQGWSLTTEEEYLKNPGKVYGEYHPQYFMEDQ